MSESCQINSTMYLSPEWAKLSNVSKFSANCLSSSVPSVKVRPATRTQVSCQGEENEVTSLSGLSNFIQLDAADDTLTESDDEDNLSTPPLSSATSSPGQPIEW